MKNDIMSYLMIYILGLIYPSFVLCKGDEALFDQKRSSFILDLAEKTSSFIQVVFIVVIISQRCQAKGG